MFRHFIFWGAFLLAWPALNAQITITGKVMEDGSNQGLIGATILIKGTSTGTATDFDGNYELVVPSEDAVLVFSYIGWRDQEVRVGGQRVINVTLSSDATLIDEVVVIGYGTQKRSNISGSVATVTSSEITELPILRAEQALQGRAAGVQVTQNSGSPGSPLTVRVRGTSTINNSDPLYIVDGVPVDGIDFLNPNDIESINVLKDAASAAIYGARGANGVVLITTKGGRRNQDGIISYDAYYGVQQPWKMMNLLDARQYAILQNEANIAAGRTPVPELANPDLLGRGTDWQSAVFEQAPIMSHQLSFSGGSERSAFAVSGGYFAQDGIVGGPKAGFERYTARLNASHQLKNWLNVGSNLAFTALTRNALPENNEFTTPLVRALNIDPITPVRKFDGTYAYSVYADTDIANPVNAIEQTHNTWNSNRLVGALFAELQLSKNLRFRSTYSVDATYAKQDLFFPIFDLSIDTTLRDAPAVERSIVNTVVKQDYTWRNWQWENVLTYNQTFAGRHALDVTLGTTALENDFLFLSGANTGLPSNNVANAYLGNTIDPRESQAAGDGRTQSSLLSYFGRANYVLDDKYLFSLTMRVDGSSRFGPNNRYGYFPSVSAGWIVSQEDFWNLDAISFLKLRASWGQNGNDRIGDYSFTTVVFPGQNYTFGPNETITSGSAPIEASNPDLRWETSEQTNFGLDIELWDGKLNFTSDYYIKTTRDMLARVPIPLIVGVRAPFQNVGSMENKGLELALQYRNRTQGLRYSFGGNISFVNTTVLSLGEGGEPIVTGRVFSAGNVSRTEVGHPVGAFFGYVTNGIFQNSEEIAAHAFQSSNTAPGDIRFLDLNGDGIIDERDQTFIGDPTPDFTYGVTGSLEYKGFDLNLFVQGSQGNDIFNGIFRYDFFYTNRPQSALNRWTGPGTSNTEPRANRNDPNGNARASDRFVEDGSYVRLKNLQVGYSLPQSLLSRLNLQQCRFYVGGTNLITLTKYSGLDPEIGVVGDVFGGGTGRLEIGIDRGFYPQPRMFITGVTVVF
jgi:TonB-dependent starch-binding outer membrane protein SusC